MKNARFCIIAVLSLVFVIASCGQRHRVKGEYEDFVGSAISLPDSLSLVLYGDITELPAKLSRPTLIIYYDSTECTSCAIGHLVEYTKLFEYAKINPGIDVMVLFSPASGKVGELLIDAFASEMDYKIYVDTHGDFPRLNPQIPRDSRFHTFLVGEDGVPVFIGNPVGSDEMWNLFLQYAESLSNNS